MMATFVNHGPELPFDPTELPRDVTLHNEIVYAGFTRRALALIIDGLAQVAASIFYLLGCILLFLIIGQVGGNEVEVCSDGSLGFRNCAPKGYDGLVFILSIGYVVYSLCAWWFLIPGRMAALGGSVGMSALGMRIVTANGHSHISSGKAFFRALAMGMIQIGLAAGFALILAFVMLILGQPVAPSGGGMELQWWVFWIVLGSLLVPCLPFIWMLLDRQSRTLHDIAADTIVILKQ